MKRLILIALLFLWSRQSHAQESIYYLDANKTDVLNGMHLNKDYHFFYANQYDNKLETNLSYVSNDFPAGFLIYYFHSDKCYAYSLTRDIKDLDIARQLFNDKNNYFLIGKNEWENNAKSFKVKIPADDINSNTFTIYYSLVYKSYSYKK